MQTASHRLGERPPFAPPRGPGRGSNAPRDDEPDPASASGGGPYPADVVTAGIVHDFNNLLSVILTCASELERDIEDPTQRSRASEIREAGRRGAELTRRLLEVGRGRTASPVPVDLNRAVAESETLLQRTLGDAIRLRCRLDPRLPAAMLPAGQIEQVLVSLVDNCRDAVGPETGTVEIRTRLISAGREDGLPGVGWYSAIAVTDDGAGMPPDVAARAGEPFFTTKGAGGNGLGLAGARNLARTAGGDLRVSSVPDRGTTVELLFPAVRSSGDPLTLRRAPLGHGCR